MCDSAQKTAVAGQREKAGNSLFKGEKQWTDFPIDCVSQMTCSSNIYPITNATHTHNSRRPPKRSLPSKINTANNQHEK